MHKICLRPGRENKITANGLQIINGANISAIFSAIDVRDEKINTDDVDVLLNDQSDQPDTTKGLNAQIKKHKPSKYCKESDFDQMTLFNKILKGNVPLYDPFKFYYKPKRTKVKPQNLEAHR